MQVVPLGEFMDPSSVKIDVKPSALRGKWVFFIEESRDVFVRDVSSGNNPLGIADDEVGGVRRWLSMEEVNIPPQ